MKKIITIENMNCEHCKNRIETVLKATKDVKAVKVDLKSKTAAVSLKNDIPDDILMDIIKKAGYNPVKTEIKKGLFF